MTFKTERFSRRGRSLLRVALVVGMVALLAVQLGWWLIFFELNQKAASAIASRVEILEESIVNGETVPYDLRAGMVPKGARFVVDPKRRAAREARHRRQLAMLFAETLFVLCVIGYGSYRVIRSLQSEIALNRDRNIFLDAVSHELKTPIAGLRLALQTLLRREYPAQQRTEVLEGALRDADRLEEQVANLLTAAGLARAGRGLKRTGGQCDLNLQTGELIARLNDENATEPTGNATEGRPRLIFRGTAGPLFVPVRPELVETVLANLIRNALSYAADSPAIDISVVSHGEEAVLVVADRGPGIPEDQRTRVFEPLYRIPSGASPHRGTGMGLYIVAEIVQSAGGTVSARARDGGGAILEVRLPGSEKDALSGGPERSVTGGEST